jgi:hypothetical protein
MNRKGELPGREKREGDREIRKSNRGVTTIKFII